MSPVIKNEKVLNQCNLNLKKRMKIQKKKTKYKKVPVIKIEYMTLPDTIFLIQHTDILLVVPGLRRELPS